MTKLCGKCRRHLPVDFFNKNRAATDGRQAYCRACQKHYIEVRRERVYRDRHVVVKIVRKSIV